MDFTQLIPIVVVPIVRNIAGWFENAVSDGKISEYEWALLGSTVVRLGIIGLATYFGLNGVGISVDGLGASAGAVVLDFILSALKSKKK